MSENLNRFVKKKNSQYQINDLVYWEKTIKVWHMILVSRSMMILFKVQCNRHRLWQFFEFASFLCWYLPRIIHIHVLWFFGLMIVYNVIWSEKCPILNFMLEIVICIPLWANFWTSLVEIFIMWSKFRQFTCVFLYLNNHRTDCQIEGKKEFAQITATETETFCYFIKEISINKLYY